MENKEICPKCKQKYNRKRWEKLFRPWREDYCVCDDCINDRMRHNIIENFFGYNEKPIVNEEKFNLLLHCMAFENRFNFYDWFLRESSKHNLLSPSIFDYIGTGSPYPCLVRPIVNFIIDSYGKEFYEYLNNHLDNLEHSQQNLIISNIPNTIEFIEYRFEVNLRSIDSIIKKLFNKEFKISSLSNQELENISSFFHKYSYTRIWNNYGIKLNEDNLTQLIKSLVHIENVLSLSTRPDLSPIIALCKILFKPIDKLSYCDRLHGRQISFLNYILANTNNRFIPFGENNFNSRSLEEFFSYYSSVNKSQLALLEAKNKSIETKEKLSKEKEPFLKQLSKIQEEIEHIDRAICKEEKFLKKFKHFQDVLNLNPIDRLKFISENIKSPEYYPDFLVDIDEKFIKLLDEDTRASLTKKLKHVKRGYYRNLRNMLLKHEGN